MGFIPRYMVWVRIGTLIWQQRIPIWERLVCGACDSASNALPTMVLAHVCKAVPLGRQLVGLLNSKQDKWHMEVNPCP